MRVVRLRYLTSLVFLSFLAASCNSESGGGPSVSTKGQAEDQSFDPDAGDALTSDLNPINESSANDTSSNALDEGIEIVDQAQVVDLSDQDLGEKDFREQDLQFADLSGANLKKANLLGADLRGAIIEGAEIKRFQLFSAILDENFILPNQDLISKRWLKRAIPSLKRRMHRLRDRRETFKDKRDQLQRKLVKKRENRREMKIDLEKERVERKVARSQLKMERDSFKKITQETKNESSS